MKREMPPRVWDTGRAREQVAQHLGLAYRDEMQDWPWQVALPEKIDDYFQLYARSTDDEERVVLMEMLLEAASGQRTVAALDREWLKIKLLLDQAPSLHAWVALYWCVWSGNEPDEWFNISPYVREWWTANYDVPREQIADYY